jgi:hypothetical protein
MPRLFVLMLVLASPALVASQGRADEEKRPASPAPKKEHKPAPKASPVPSYTNDDLKKGSATPEGEGTAGDAATEASEQPPAYSEEGTDATGPVEGDWRNRAEQQRQAIATAEAAVVSLEEASKELGLRILMSTDTYEILDLRRQQQEMAGQVEEARRNVAQAKQAMDDLETEARRARVPPGWLRER